MGGAEAEGEKISSEHMWEMLWEEVRATYIIISIISEMFPSDKG